MLAGVLALVLVLTMSPEAYNVAHAANEHKVTVKVYNKVTSEPVDGARVLITYPYGEFVNWNSDSLNGGQPTYTNHPPAKMRDAQEERNVQYVIRFFPDVASYRWQITCRRRFQRWMQLARKTDMRQEPDVKFVIRLFPECKRYRIPREGTIMPR